MRKIMIRSLSLLILLIGCNLHGSAQRIDVDIFDDLTYESTRGEYSAKLEKNIFDDLIFSDSRGNEITLTMKYVKKLYGDIYNKKEAKIGLFRRMIHTHRYERNYKATYDVDIFDSIIFEDNRNRRVEIGKDIFGNETYEEINNGETYAMSRNLNGGLEYTVGNDKASLQQDIFGNWVYEDNLGNEFKFSARTWSRLINQFGSEENIFNYLINEFLLL